MTNKQNLENTSTEKENIEVTDAKEKKPRRSRKDNKLQKQLEETQIELAEMKDKFLRLFAEFDNFKKRNSKERIDLMKNAGQKMITDLLPVLDDFNRAKKSAEDENTDEIFSEGVELVYHKLNNILKSKGLEEMSTNGEEFNPEYHESITKIPAPTEEMKGKVIDTIQTGYTLNDKIIRHPQVVVGE